MSSFKTTLKRVDSPHSVCDAGKGSRSRLRITCSDTPLTVRSGVGIGGDFDPKRRERAGRKRHGYGPAQGDGRDSGQVGPVGLDAFAGRATRVSISMRSARRRAISIATFSFGAS